MDSYTYMTNNGFGKMFHLGKNDVRQRPKGHNMGILNELQLILGEHEQMFVSCQEHGWDSSDWHPEKVPYEHKCRICGKNLLWGTDICKKCSKEQPDLVKLFS